MRRRVFGESVSNCQSLLLSHVNQVTSNNKCTTSSSSSSSAISEVKIQWEKTKSNSVFLSLSLSPFLPHLTWPFECVTVFYFCFFIIIYYSNLRFALFVCSFSVSHITKELLLCRLLESLMWMRAANSFLGWSTITLFFHFWIGLNMGMGLQWDQIRTFCFYMLYYFR